jgi:hypothetical protein
MKECPKCLRKIEKLNLAHIKNCFGTDVDYKYKYIIYRMERTIKKRWVYFCQY